MVGDGGRAIGADRPGTVSDGSSAGQVPETAAGFAAAAVMTGAGGGAVVGGLVVGARGGRRGRVGPVAEGLAVGEPVVEGLAVASPWSRGWRWREPVAVVPTVPGFVAERVGGPIRRRGARGTRSRCSRSARALSW